MLRLPKFKYYAPTTVKETIAMLGDHGPEAMLVAGGTDVYPKMKRRQFTPKALIGISDLGELKLVRGDAQNGWRVGAGVTLSALAEHPDLRAHYPGLTTSAGVVSTPLLRNMGTVGGNLCLDTRCNYYDQTREWRQAIGWCMKAPGDGLSSEQVPCRVAPGSPKCLAVSSTDTAPMLIALDAEITLVSPKGERRIPVGALYGSDGMNYLSKQADELLTEIHLPPPAGKRSAYLKLRRRGAFDFPVLGAAVALQLDEDDVVQWARVVLGGVDSFPVHAEAAETVLLGQKLDAALAQAAGDAAFKPARPMDNTDYHLYYRKKMVPVFVKRALQQAAGLA